MPATYSHKRTYEQITGRSRNTWKQPEPAATPKQRTIADFVVDNETYRKYGSMTWDLGDGVSRSIYGVRIYATSADIAENYPELAARAKELYAQIGKEIYSKNDGKDNKNMKTPRTAADFIDALSDIYTESRNAYAVLQDKVDKAAAKMERAREELRDPSCEDKQMAQIRFDIAQKEYQIAEGSRRREYNAMVSGHEKKVAELRAQFAAHLEDHYSASPDKLDAATMQLLGSGICTPAELARLVDRHQGSPTMLRIIGGYAKNLLEDNRHKMSSENQIICSNVYQTSLAAKDGRRELRIFDEAVTATAYGLGKDAAHASRMATHIPEWMEGFKGKMNNLPIVPDEMAPPAELPTDPGQGSAE